ncbi:hypothetical protein ABZ383_00605 [Streptomyces sp. NPDC005900]|uniref:hypothetical protein n=1 Tax=Streptomyces sp. NPDC005900 TaxID=3154569 RepID=UPI0033E6CACB
MTTTTPTCGCDQTVFRCGRCGTEHTATTETDYLKAVGVHGDAHAVWDCLNAIERDGLASILRTILSAPELAAELLALADRRREQVSRAADGPHPHPLTPADLPPNEDWSLGCPECHLPVQGGGAGLAAHRRTVHDPPP